MSTNGGPIFTFSLPGGAARPLALPRQLRHMMCESMYIFLDEGSRIYSLNRNWIADETLDDCLRLAATNTGIAKGTIVS